ncbi:MAG TPA: hypothetical protein VGD16_02200 [Enterovirga sp.]|jgi:hypothetical protein
MAEEDHTFCRQWIGSSGEVLADPAAPARRGGDFACGVPFSAGLGAEGGQAR